MFDSAKQKIDRADYHIADLERQFTAFVAGKPHRFSVETNPDTGDQAIRIRFLKEAPRSLALIIGDAINNLRCALDHAMWEMVGIEKGTQDRYLFFPTRDNRVNFEAACNGIKTPGQWVKDTIRATEAFDGGAGQDLFDLNGLNNADKHTVITPILKGTSHPKFRIVRPDGITIVVMEGNTFLGGAPELIPLVGGIPPECRIELDKDDECPPSIFIRKPNGHWVPVFVILPRLLRKVADTIAFFETKVPV